MSGAESLVYKLPPDAKIGTFDRMDWYQERFLRSDTVTRAIADKCEAAAFYSVMLWSAAFSEKPIGTIPVDPVLQTQLVHLGADHARWGRVSDRALRGFKPLVTPEGAPLIGRLGHEVTIEVAEEAWDRHLTHERAKAQRREEQRRNRVRAAARKAEWSPEVLKSTAQANLHLAFLDENNLSIAPRNLIEARAAIAGGWQPRDSDVVGLDAWRDARAT